MTAPLRRPLHRGSALANGLFVDVSALGEDEARRRILSLWKQGSEVHRTGDHLLIAFAAPTRLHASESPGGLLVRRGNLLSAAPLDDDELAAHDKASLHALFCEGGVPRTSRLDASTRQDPSTWLDVEDFELTEGVFRLGTVHVSPARAIEPVSIDVRETLGVGAEPPGAEATRRALLSSLGQETTVASSRSALASGGGGGESALSSLFGRLLAGIASVLGALLPSRTSDDDSDDSGLSGDGAMGRGRGGTRSLAKAGQTRPVRSPWDALAHRLRIWTARILVWTRLAQRIGRRQAEYLSRMMDMFERGALDEALKHAIALGNGGSGDVAPALGTPSPRGDLKISPYRGVAATALLGTGDLLAELKRLYRKAFETLEARGEIDKAAFVLAELLQANEEAVSFLERHGRLRLAAEIAEARGVADGIIVRQWILANEPARAIRIARARGAFSDAVARLRASGHEQEATSLQLLWADHLAAAGDYAAAVEVIWSIPEARPLARDWLDRAIKIGGVVGARAAIRKVTLDPAAFPEVRDLALGWLRDRDEDGLAMARALGDTIVRADDKENLALRALAKPVLRALLRSREPDDVTLADRLVVRAKDAALTADVRRGRTHDRRRHLVRLNAIGASTIGRSRSVNEDAVLVSTLTAEPPKGHRLQIVKDEWKQGLVLAAVDGLGSGRGGLHVARLTCDSLRRALSEGAPDEDDASEMADRMAKAVRRANADLWAAQQEDVARRGAGATLAAATIAGDSLVIANVGDCRAYICRGGALTQISEDHTLLSALIADGKLTPEEAETFEHKNVVTRAVGVQDKIEPHVARVPLHDGDVILLCTNGLWDVLSDATIGRVLQRGGSPKVMLDRLLREWRGGDNDDDVALVVARCEMESEPSKTAPVVAPITLQTAETGERTSSEYGQSDLGARHYVIEAGDAGALLILDAVELPDGRLFVALGEAGSRLLAKDGRTIASFVEPAERIVISDHGDRALVVAMRGLAMRIARIDLAGMREQAWCDAHIGAFAPDFDGSLWYVSSGGEMSAIDATDTAWSALFTYREPDASAVFSITRHSQQVITMYRLEDGGTVMIPHKLPGHTRLPQRRIKAIGDAPRPACTLSAHPAHAGAIAEIGVDEAGSRVLAMHAEPFAEGSTRRIPVAPHPPYHILDACPTWLVVLARSDSPGEHTIHVFRHAARDEPLRVTLRGPVTYAGARLTRGRLTIFDSRGRLLVISLRTLQRLRDLRLA